MEPAAFVGAMLTVGRRFSIDVKEPGALLVKLVVLSVKYVSKEALWRARFGEDYVDWPLLHKEPARSILGGTSEWLALLDYMRWDDVAKHEATLATAHPPLHGLRAHMKACGLDTGDADAWTLVCRVFLLLLVQGLPSLSHTLEVLTCGAFKRDTRSGCVHLLAKQAEHLYTPAEYEAALGFVLDRAAVDARRLEQTLAHSRAALEERKVNLRLSQMTVIQGRPRLRDRVTSVLRTEERKAQVDTHLDTWDSYTGFCYKHQFPPTLSDRVKTRLYFMASQTRWDWRRHLALILPGGGPLLARVAEHPVAQPDLPMLLRVLEALSMDGSAPFAEMSAFRAACFESFPVTHVQRMTLSQILQLYVAAYQPASVWKEAWKHLIGVISVQIIRDVESFAGAHAFADADVMRLLASQ